jgi:hypothetical protein
LPFVSGGFRLDVGVLIGERHRRLRTDPVAPEPPSTSAVLNSQASLFKQQDARSWRISAWNPPNYTECVIRLIQILSLSCSFDGSRAESGLVHGHQGPRASSENAIPAFDTLHREGANVIELDSR